MSIAPVNVPRTALARREQQKRSCVATATQSLVQRGRVSDLIRGKRRRGTAYLYRRVWADFAAFLGWRLGDRPLEAWASATNAERAAETDGLHEYLDRHVGAVDVNDVNAYVEALLHKPIVDRRGRKKVGLENSTINTRLSALRHLFRTAVRMELRTDNPADPEHVDRRRVTNPYRPTGLGAEATSTLLEGLDEAVTAAPDDYLPARDRMLIVLLLLLGIRREEACELRADAVQAAPPEEGGLALDLVRKGDRHETLLLPLDVGEALTAYVERWNLGGYLFLSCPRGLAPEAAQRQGAAPMSPDDVTAAVQARTRAILGRRRSPHALRHTFVTTALDAGAPLHEVQRFVGHASPATTERYIDRRISRRTSPAELVGPALKR